MVRGEGVEGVPSQLVPGVHGLHLHVLHAPAQGHVLNGREVGAAAGAEAPDEPAEGLPAQHVAGSPAHVALADEGSEPAAQVERLLRVVPGQQVAQVLHHHEGVVIRLQESVGVLEVVLVDVLEGPDGLPVQVLPALTDVQLHRGEVAAHRAHVENRVAAPGPGRPQVPGPGLQGLGPRHDPAQDPRGPGGVVSWRGQQRPPGSQEIKTKKEQQNQTSNQLSFTGL